MLIVALFFKEMFIVYWDKFTCLMNKERDVLRISKVGLNSRENSLQILQKQSNLFGEPHRWTLCMQYMQLLEPNGRFWGRNPKKV